MLGKVANLFHFSVMDLPPYLSLQDFPKMGYTYLYRLPASVLPLLEVVNSEAIAHPPAPAPSHRAYH